jgi:antitoxin (DNA-binding transcriptional repressor) of toxin-antitoxin stability system
VGVDGIIITKHGKPVAKLVPIESEFTELLGALEGKLTGASPLSCGRRSASSNNWVALSYEL